MVARIETVAFRGIEAVAVDVQVVTIPGKIGMNIVGLADKAIAESKERVQAAIHALSLAVPLKKTTINLAPADLPKEGSHYDLPIAIGLLMAMDLLPQSLIDKYVFLGELALDGTILPVQGVLSAALYAKSCNKGLVCPYLCASQVRYFDKDIELLAVRNLLELIYHFTGKQRLREPEMAALLPCQPKFDLADIKGQKLAKRVLEVAAAGGHHLLFIGPPGSGKSMLAQRLPSILPPLTAQELLEVALIASLAGVNFSNELDLARPFRDPHHGASMAAMVGGGLKAKPGELSLAHNGVLFLDEFPEFSPKVLDSLRQPLETQYCVIARANYHIRYPAQIQLIAAMNPCRCGMAQGKGQLCSRAPKCQAEYQARISGPLLDRIDLRLYVPNVPMRDLLTEEEGEKSAIVLERVIKARKRQEERFSAMGFSDITLNARCPASLMEKIVMLDNSANNLLSKLESKRALSARSYHRLLKVARTIADMEESDKVSASHLAEAISYRIELAESSSPKLS